MKNPLYGMYKSGHGNLTNVTGGYDPVYDLTPTFKTEVLLVMYNWLNAFSVK